MRQTKNVLRTAGILFAAAGLLGCAAQSPTSRRHGTTIRTAQPHEAPAANNTQPAHDIHWSYDGNSGPEHWGALHEAFGSCADGQQQSPIDLRTARLAALTPPQISWHQSTGQIVNNGRTIQINVKAGSTMELDGKSYALLQFHFHHASEHTIGGAHYPLEAHFVHKAKDGTLGVLGVFFEEGADNPTLGQLWALAPTSEGEADEHVQINPAALLPANQRHWRYQGSLTTPPCSEIVDWVVYQQPIEASKIQLEAFSKVFEHNFRPVQPLNRRYVLGSK